MPTHSVNKSWSSLEEASRVLSELYKKPVFEKDLLRLVLDGRLNLAVHFTESTLARLGSKADPAQTRRSNSKISQSESTFDLEGLSVVNGVSFGPDSEVIVIDGVWNLIFYGDIKIDIELLYNVMMGEPVIDPRLGGSCMYVYDQNSTFEVSYMTSSRKKFFYGTRSEFHHFLKGEYNEPLILHEDFDFVLRSTEIDSIRHLFEQNDEQADSSSQDRSAAIKSQVGKKPDTERWNSWIAELVAYIHEDGIPAGTGTEYIETIIAKVEERLRERGVKPFARATVQKTVTAVLLRLRGAGNP